MKIGIIGLGNVGSTTAYTLMLQNLATELVLIENDEIISKGQTIDLEDAAQNLAHDVKLTYNDYAALKDAEILLIAVGDIKALQGWDRLLELDVASKMIDDIAPKIVASGFNGLIISITNPCDVIAHYLQVKIGFPTDQVIGSGALLDTNRLKNTTGRDDVLIIGEHGESQVAVGNVSDPDAKEAAKRGWHVLKAKGYTSYGIASSVAKIIKDIQLGTETEMPLSVYDSEAHAYYSALVKLNKKGVINRRLPTLNEKEAANLETSINVIKQAFNSLIS